MLKITYDENRKPVVSDDGAEAKPAMASMSSGFTAFGIPVGDAFLGGAAATVISEVSGGLLTGLSSGALGTYGPPVTKLAAAWLVHKYWKSGAGNAAAMFLTYDAIRDLLPIDNILKGITGKVAGTSQDMRDVGGSAIGSKNGQLERWLSDKGA